MFRRILVPVDGSHTSNLGLDEAIRLAKDQRATLFLLHVVDERVLTQTLEIGGTYVDQLLEALRRGGASILAKATAKVRRQRVQAKAALVENFTGTVADVIVRHARKVRADVIVLGTHGRRGITRLVMGSDAEGVVRASPVPVLLVRSIQRGARRR